MFLRPEIRNDKQGQGHFGAKRGSRTHKGIDFCAAIGAPIHSHVDGVVTKIGYPYAQKFDTKKNKLKSALRYVEVTDIEKRKHRFFYVDPCVGIGDPIKPGTCIGKCQDLESIYKGMLNHCHVECKKGDDYLNPDQFLS